MTSKQNLLTIKQKHSERRERQRLKGVWWAIVLIWAGLVFGADSMELLPQIGDANSWSWIFLGAGMVAILGSFYRLSSANVANPSTWDWIWGSICLIFGLDGFLALHIFWPLILILVGGAVLVKGLWWRV